MAILTRFDPFRDLARIQEEVLSGMLDERERPARRVGRLDARPATSSRTTTRWSSARRSPAWTPRTSTSASRTACSPCKGERKIEKEEQKENYHRVEMAYGSFTRTFALPTSVDPEKVHAESKHGVLSVHLPKRAEAKPRSIQVKVAVRPGALPRAARRGSLHRARGRSARPAPPAPSCTARRRPRPSATMSAGVSMLPLTRAGGCSSTAHAGLDVPGRSRRGR